MVERNATSAAALVRLPPTSDLAAVRVALDAVLVSLWQMAHHSPDDGAPVAVDRERFARLVSEVTHAHSLTCGALVAADEPTDDGASNHEPTSAADLAAIFSHADPFAVCRLLGVTVRPMPLGVVTPAWFDLAGACVWLAVADDDGETRANLRRVVDQRIRPAVLGVATDAAHLDTDG